MKKIFFVSYGGGHIKIVDLICRQLAQRADVDFSILALTTAHAQVIDRYGPLRVKRVSDYLELFDDSIDEILRCGLELVGDSHNSELGIPRFESLAYMGVCYHDLVRQHGEEEAGRRYAERGRQAFLPVEALRRIIEHEQADTVVATTSPRCEQAALIAGNELGLKTVEVLDLCGELYPLPEAQHIVVLNEEVEASLRRQGLEDRTYHSLGQPAFEETVQRVAAVDAVAVRERMQISAGAQVLLFAAHRLVVFDKDFSVKRFLPYDAVYNRLFGLFDRLTEEFDLEILLRLHPSESRSDYAPYLARHPQVRLVNDELNLYESIAVADYVLTGSSTVGIESLLCGKTALTFMHELDEYYPQPRAQQPPFIFSRGLDELEESLRSVLQNGHEFDLKSIYRPNAAENIGELLAVL